MDIENNMLKNEKHLSQYACLDADAIRLKPLTNSDFRPNYFKDIDRIIYSLSYSRYIDKTQVFSNVENDHISKRIIHVQMVSKIARTIGRALNLNEDLIEAIALGHDIGHVPFGHPGESILNKISLEHHEGPFMHNAQSARTLMEVDNNGLGNNLTIQVLDGILCHNGELEQKEYFPKQKTITDFLDDYHNCFKDVKYGASLVPMTLEGCVVRISDIIGYLGRDIEDAIRLKVIKITDIPTNIVKVLGKTNSQIINTIIVDIINNSYGKPYLRISDDIYNAIVQLKKFNCENIYYKANSNEQLKKYEEMFNYLFEYYLSDIKGCKESCLFKDFLSHMDLKYVNETSDVRKVIDYIAGMTDDYFVKQYELVTKKHCQNV